MLARKLDVLYALDFISKIKSRSKAPVRSVASTLTFSVPGRHGDDPVDPSFSHGTDHGAHGLRVSRHGGEQ